jgi:hypothetical protein
MKKYLLIAVIAFLLNSCGNEVAPDTEINFGNSGAYILCEGLQGMDNTTLYRYDAASGQMLPGDFFKRQNGVLKLGDTGTDLVVRGDTAFAVIASSGVIEIFKKSDGKSLGRIFTNAPFQSLKALCFVNDSIAFVTSGYEHSVYEINVFKREVVGKIAVGAFPEGLDFTGKHVVVANSGYGDLGKDMPKANTISIIDPVLKKEINNIPTGKNPIAVIANNKKNKFYVLYNNLPDSWAKDSIGGIIEYDAVTFLKNHEWKIASQSYAFENSPDGNMLFALTPRGVEAVSLLKNIAEAEVIVPKIKKTDIWYALGIDPKSGDIWIGNARNHQVEGEVIVANKNGEVIKTFPVGVNPNTIVFF